MSPKQLLPFTGSLNRATGAPSQDPTGFSDLLNVLLLDATLRLRPALGSPAVTIPGTDAVCHIGAFEAGGNTIYVTFTESSREVEVWAGDLQGQNPVLIGSMGTLDAQATTPPLFSLAESYSVLVVAHDEENVAKRLTTFRYDPADIGNEWLEVTADLNDDGDDDDVKARWVAAHLGYMMYGGFGQEGAESRPELVRISNPDDPTTLEPMSYVIIGERDNPAVGGRSLGDGPFVVGKPGQLWKITGTSRADWEPHPIDLRVGCANHRAMIIQDGRLYVWSDNGPFVTDGGAAVPAGLELDLPSAYPADLPLPGPTANVWGLALPDERHVVFFHPNPVQDTMLGYVCSLRRPTNPRWGLWVAPTCLHGGVVNNGFAAASNDPGYADPVTALGSQGTGAAQIVVTITHNEAVGDESVEVWYKPAAGVWTLNKTVAIDTSNATQDITLDTGIVGGAFEVQVRYKRLGKVHPGYEDPDPDMWLPGSLATGTVVVIGLPTLVVTYTTATGTLAGTWDQETPAADFDVEFSTYVDRSGAPLGVSVAPFVVSYSAGTLLFSSDLVAGPLAALVAARNGGEFIKVRIRQKIGAVVGAWSGYQTVFAGFLNAPSVAISFSTASVSLGTRWGYDWTDSPDAAGKTVTDTEAKHYTEGWGAYPNNGGCSVSAFYGFSFYWGANGEVTLSLGVVSPVDVAAPACGTCQLAGQYVAHGAADVRQRITDGTWTHYTKRQIVPESPIYATCTA